MKEYASKRPYGKKESYTDILKTNKRLVENSQYIEICGYITVGNTKLLSEALERHRAIFKIPGMLGLLIEAATVNPVCLLTVITAFQKQGSLL